jgi:uncharacterized protein YndB with AHSA1/START domain
MTEESIKATATVDAAAEDVFAVLADPSTHAAIDGTGWVREALADDKLSRPGQIFRVAMYHPNHPDGHYEMANRVQLFEPPHTIAWEPGQDSADDGEIKYGGWFWRYDLDPVAPSETTVTLTYDWSSVPQFIREYIQFPPFDHRHLDDSLRHLAEITASTRTAGN